jgi:hypothetical protein
MIIIVEGDRAALIENHEVVDLGFLRCVHGILILIVQQMAVRYHIVDAKVSALLPI